MKALLQLLHRFAPLKMEGPTLPQIAETSATTPVVESRHPKFGDLAPANSFRVGLGKKIEHRRNRVHRLSHSGGSNGRTFDLDDIASGSNGSHVTSTDRACRVTVTVLAAKDLKRNASGPDARDPVFKVRVEHVLRKSKDIKNGINQVLYSKANNAIEIERTDVLRT